MTTSEQAFIDAYMINGFNATDACREAYPKIEGPERYGRKVRYRPHVDKEIERRFAERKMSEDEALALNAEVARFDIGEILDEVDICCPRCHIVLQKGVAPSLEKAHKLGLTKMIKKVTVYKDGRTAIELHDQSHARDTVFKAEGTFRSGEGALSGLAALAAMMKKGTEPPKQIDVPVTEAKVVDASSE